MPTPRCLLHPTHPHPNAHHLPTVPHAAGMPSPVQQAPPASPHAPHSLALGVWPAAAPGEDPSGNSKGSELQAGPIPPANVSPPASSAPLPLPLRGPHQLPNFGGALLAGGFPCCPPFLDSALDYFHSERNMPFKHLLSIYFVQCKLSDARKITPLATRGSRPARQERWNKMWEPLSWRNGMSTTGREGSGTRNMATEDQRPERGPRDERGRTGD